jgi:lambda family phage tail tape measure protein
LNTAGMGAKAQAQYALILKATEDFDKEMDDLNTKHNKSGPNGIDDFVFGQSAAKAKQNYADRLAQEKKFAADTLAIQADWRTGASKAFAEYQDNAANVASQTQTLFTNAFTGMENAIVTFATTGKLSFKSFVTSVLTDLARMEAKAATSQLLGMVQNLIGGYFGGGGSGAGVVAQGGSGVGGGFTGAGLGGSYAKGGAFDSGVQKFADGGSFTNGVVNSPTNFNMGQMGEAGPEAIVPLTRTSDGSLGVKQTGGGAGGPAVGNVSIAVNVNNSGVSGDTQTGSTASETQKQFANVMRQVAVEQIGKEMRQGGLLWKMKNGQTGN